MKTQTRHDTRVTGSKLGIDSERVGEFFEARGENLSADHPLTSVLYQDHNPQLAAARDAEEKKLITPRLGLDGSQNVLDLGCGIGRWADALLDHVASYTGIDASSSLCDAARSRVKHAKATFVQWSAADLGALAIDRKKFELFIISGLFLYLNDDDVSSCLRAFGIFSAPNATIYLREPVAMKERLTLRDHWSEELSSHYSAIYRTTEELESLVNAELEPFNYAPCRLEALFGDSLLNNRTETRQFFSIFERR